MLLFLVDLINIEIFRISFNFFYSFYFILRSRATSVSKREKARLHRPWRQTLIIKLMGRLVGYSYLARSLKTLWKPKSPMEIVAIDNVYFLAKFEYVEDYNLQSTRGFGGFKPLSDCEEVGSYFLPQF